MGVLDLPEGELAGLTWSVMAKCNVQDPRGTLKTIVCWKFGTFRAANLIHVTVKLD